MDRRRDNLHRPLIMFLGGEAATQGEQFGVGVGAIDRPPPSGPLGLLVH